jgi:large subunit ribosomal protein L6
LVGPKEKRNVVARVGSKPIPVVADVHVTIDDYNTVTVGGPRGTLSQAVHRQISVLQEDGVIKVGRPSDLRHHRALHGLTRALLSNMMVGVTDGFQKALDLVGTGYRVQQSGDKVVLQVGFSHPVEFDPPQGIQVTAESPTRLLVAGCDKQQVGQVAAVLRSIRPPDAYKGKGIRYVGEQVRLKPGKTAARK